MDARAIGERLKRLRGRRSRLEVSEAIGVSISALAMYESGNRIPRDEIKIRFARYYARSIQEIFFA